MADANITILGNLTKDPVLRDANQSKVCNFTVAVRTSMKDSSGNYISNFYEVEWFGGKLMDYVMNNVKKGYAVIVSGEPIMYPFESKKTGTTGHGLKLKATSVSTPKGIGSNPSTQAHAQAAPANNQTDSDDLDLADL